MSNSFRLTAGALSLSGLSPAGFAFLFAEILESQPSKNSLVLAPDNDGAEKIFGDMEFVKSFRVSKWEKMEPLFLPSWDHSPYRGLQPSASSRHERLKVLHRMITSQTPWTLVCSPSALIQVGPSLGFMRETISVKLGLKMEPDEISRKLDRLGYQRSESVEDAGTYGIRGGIVDVYSPIFHHPARIELLDDKVESIRIFNPESQRSIRILNEGETVELVPVRDFPCDQTSLSLARERMKQWCDFRDFPKIARERLSSLLQQGIVTPEMDYWVPFFFDEPSWVSSFIPNGVNLFVVEPEKLKSAYATWIEKQKQQFQSSVDKYAVVPQPEALYQDLNTAIEKVCWGSQSEVRELSIGENVLPRSEKIFFSVGEKPADIGGLYKKIVSLQEKNCSVVILANSQSQINRILFLLQQNKIRTVQIRMEADLPKDPSIVSLVIGSISESFFLSEKNVSILTEDDIFGFKHHSRKSKRAQNPPPVFMNDLQVGDLVVHAEHGIGRYLGLSTIHALNLNGDFAQIEYAEGDKLYLPVYRLESLSRYVGTPGNTTQLDKLGSSSFLKTKERVKGAVKDIASDLLRIQAERNSKLGYAFSGPDNEFRRFEAEFPFDETPDQETAIQQTLDDMQSPQPMDRLICGDVGFGKTEVAIRAAFKAAQDGKQVAVLVPTTILAEQHYLTFSQRMANYPIKVSSISRFKNRKEQAQIAKELGEGIIDIIIGTHRLLSKDLLFKDLGLLIIDEEQRFGVEHKEKLKKIRATTDVLTLTATPIPRTLQMSLMGLKDVSIIRTPPGDRLSIKTHLATIDWDLIASAVRAELSRGGQVFFIHNRIQTIGETAVELQKHVPEARVVVAHGRMPEGQLEKAMIGFYKKEYDILLATAIIENGLDVPNANTLIVERADTFGLSQLYQIRGRVGRSQTRAHAYFLLPEHGMVSDEARDRLAVLQRFVELGSGYHIATHDLEIRGGGDVLGQSQSGHIASVGYEMYLDLLQEAIQKTKGEKIAAPLEEVEINVPFDALLPQDYVPDMKSRLTLYRKLSALTSEQETETAKEELRDRFGPLPRAAEELLWVVRLKVLMRSLGLKSLTLGPKGVSLIPGSDPALSPVVILALVNNHPEQYGIFPDGKFVIKGSFPTGADVYRKLRQIMASAIQ